MDAQRAAAELSTRMEGAAYADDVTRELYSTAACIYRERPLLVAEPAGHDDVAAAVGFAAEHGIPVTARGAGSSLAGQALGPGLVLDFSVHMDRVLEVNREEGWVEVEPGVVLEELNRELESTGLFFPPDPSSAGFCTVGGMLANNSSGAHSLRYGDTRSYALGIRGVDAGGKTVRTGALGSDLAEDIAAVVEGREDLVREWTPDVAKNCSGYHLHGFLETGDATPVLVGSEGTLALFTKARLRLEERPATRSTVVLYFDRLRDAGEAVPLLLDHDPSAVEIMDTTFLDLVREEEPEVARHVPDTAAASLLIEFDGDPGDVERSVDTALGAVRELATATFSADDEADREELWRVRSAGLPLLFNRGGDRRVTPFIEDAVVPPRRLPEYIRRLRSVLESHSVEAVIYGHAGEGNVHARPLLDTEDPRDRERMRRIADEVFPLVREMGGTISGEHGDGYVRTGHLDTQYGPLVELFEELKQRLDPDTVLNPDKVVGPDRMTKNLRPVTLDAEPPVPVRDAVERCHGCGACRTRTSGRMCPFYRIGGREHQTPRAMANGARAVAEGRLDPGDAEEVFGACFYCRSCAAECGTAVDAGRIHAEHASPGIRDRLLSLYGLAGYAGRRLPVPSIDPPRGLKGLLGITPDRDVPEFRGPPLAEELPREPEGENPVALFAGCHVAYYDPAPALALRDLLDRAGYSLYLPRQACCGLPFRESGNASWTRRAADKNLDNLPTDHPVVSTCPGCVAALTRDYPDIDRTHDLDVREATTLLKDLVDRGDLPPPPDTDRAVAHHAPCNAAAIGGTETAHLLRDASDLVDLEDGCCGAAGCFAYRAEESDAADEIGRGLRDALRDTDADPVTECPSCAIEINREFDAQHPVELLRDAYDEE